MPQASPDGVPCRTCGKPRGENIAEGTRCAACGRRQALQLWIACGVSAALTALTNGRSWSDAALACVVVLASMPPAYVLALLLHELGHALTARIIGLVPLRIIIGEGRAVARVGRDPQVVVGSVVLGNGATTVLDLRRDGFRTRTAVTLLAAPLLSLALAAAAWWVSAEWPLAAYAGAITVVLANLAIAIATLVPVPTFGGRVWSDLASALYVLRADEGTLSDLMAHGARDAVAIRCESGDVEGALRIAREAARILPRSALAQSLLAFTLHAAGCAAEAADVARTALAGEMDPAERAYLQQFEVERRAPAAGDGAPANSLVNH